MKTKKLSLADVRLLAEDILVHAGMDGHGAGILADIVTASERDGPRSHGLRMLPHYVQSFSSGYANPAASPHVTRQASGLLRGDGDNGYFQIAAAAARDAFFNMTRENGIAAFTCTNCHHLAGLRFDTEPLAQAGLIALGVVNSLSMIAPHGGTRPVFGTNPMSFACPREGKPPIVWDQAASEIALMDVRMAAAEGETLPREAGLDLAGQPTKDPGAILESRTLLPFGGHKGSAVALMVEILAAALAGGTLSIDNADREAHGALNIKGGATLIAIDPGRWGNAAFTDQVTRICSEIEGNGTARVAGDGRLVRRIEAETAGITVSTDLLDQLNDLRA